MASDSSRSDFVLHICKNYYKFRSVLPKVKPGYLRPLIPDEAPEDPEKWQNIMNDLERVIMPGVTHWHSPQFHAYYPTANSYPSIVADMLSDAIGCVGFSWIASPACTELEMVMMDWLGKMLQLPEEFLFSGPGRGGGVIQVLMYNRVLKENSSLDSKLTNLQSCYIEIEQGFTRFTFSTAISKPLELKRSYIPF